MQTELQTAVWSESGLFAQTSPICLKLGIIMVFETNLKINFHISPYIVCFGYSLESLWQADSNEYPQHMF